jgi:hypothetical protein
MSIENIGKDIYCGIPSLSMGSVIKFFEKNYGVEKEKQFAGYQSSSEENW